MRRPSALIGVLACVLVTTYAGVTVYRNSTPAAQVEVWAHAVQEQDYVTARRLSTVPGMVFDWTWNITERYTLGDPVVVQGARAGATTQYCVQFEGEQVHRLFVDTDEHGMIAKIGAFGNVPCPVAPQDGTPAGDRGVQVGGD